MPLSFDNWSQALLGKSDKGKAVMFVFAALLVLTLLFGLKRCLHAPAEDFPIGGEFRLIEPAVEPSPENGYIGRVAAYARKGDDTRWIQVAPGEFRDTHQPLDPAK
jgi:hypothetical protein